MTPRTVPLAALATALAACSGAQLPESAGAHPPTARSYFPLSRAAAWSFDLTPLGRTGDPPALITMRVVRDDGAGGFYMNQGRGAPALYEFAAGGVTRNGELFLREPIAEGERWQGRSGDGYVIAHVGLTRTVPAGTFHHVIEVTRTAGDATLVDGTEYRETYFYAPDVGTIEAEIPVLVAPHDARRYRLVLRGYTLNGEF